MVVEDGPLQRMSTASAMALDIQGMGIRRWLGVFKRRFGTAGVCAVPVMAGVHIIDSVRDGSEFHNFTLLDREIPGRQQISI